MTPETKAYLKSLKYIVEYCPVGIRGRAVTIDDLREYLATDPHIYYRLVSVILDSNFQYQLVWESNNI